MTLRFLLTSLGFLLAGTAFASDDTLDATGPLRVDFTVANDGAATVYVSADLYAPNLRRLGRQGSISVNGMPMKLWELPLSGFRYEMEMAEASRYELTLRRSADVPETHYVITSIPFRPIIPAQWSRSILARIVIDGSLPAGKMRPFVRMSQNGRNTVLDSEIQGGNIVIPASELARIPAGKRLCYVAMVFHQQSAQSRDKLVYAIGAEQPIILTD